MGGCTTTLSTRGNQGRVASLLPKAMPQYNPSCSPPPASQPCWHSPLPDTPLQASGSLHLLFTLLEHSFPKCNTAHSLTSFRSLPQRSPKDTSSKTVSASISQHFLPLFFSKHLSPWTSFLFTVFPYKNVSSTKSGIFVFRLWLHPTSWHKIWVGTHVLNESMGSAKYSL